MCVDVFRDNPDTAVTEKCLNQHMVAFWFQRYSKKRLDNMQVLCSKRRKTVSLKYRVGQGGNSKTRKNNAGRHQVTEADEERRRRLAAQSDRVITIGSYYRCTVKRREMAMTEIPVRCQ